MSVVCTPGGASKQCIFAPLKVHLQGVLSHTWGTCASGKNISMLFSGYRFGAKAQIFSPNPLGNQPINTTPFIHNYSFKHKEVQWEGKH